MSGLPFSKCCTLNCKCIITRYVNTADRINHMAFIRSRKETGAGGDFGRQERQQLVLQAMANKMANKCHSCISINMSGLPFSKCCTLNCKCIITRYVNKS
jgi:hypothetical protein